MLYQFKENVDYIMYFVDVFGQFDWNFMEYFNVIVGLRFDYFFELNVCYFLLYLGLMYKIGNCLLRGFYVQGFCLFILKEMYMNFYMVNIMMIYGNLDLELEISYNFLFFGEYIKNCYNFMLIGYYNLVYDCIEYIFFRDIDGMIV